MAINVFEGARRIAKLITLLWVVGCVIYTIDDVLDLRKQNLEVQAKKVGMANADETPWQEPVDESAYLAKAKELGFINERPSIDESAYLAKARELGFINNEPTAGQKVGIANADKTPWQSDGEVPDLTPDDIAAYRAWKAKKQQAKQLPDIDPTEFAAWEKQQSAHQTANDKELPDFTPEEIAAYRAKKSQVNQPSPELIAEYDAWKAKKQQPEKTLGQKTLEHIGMGLLWLFGGVAFIWALSWAIGWIVRGFFGIPSGHDFKP